MIAAALLCALFQAGGERAWLAHVELEGPLEAATFALPGESAAPALQGRAAWTTHVDAGLRAGERRRVLVPMAKRRVPEVRVEGGGSARFDAFSAGPDALPLGALPAGLRARPLPPVEDGNARRLAPATWALLAASAVLILSLRRRPALALAAGAAAGAALVAAQARLAAPAPPGLVLFDADLASDSWRRIRARAGALELEPASAREPAGAPLSVVTRPSGAALTWHVDLAGGVWSARAPGARVYALDTERPAGSLARVNNALFDLERVWLREGGAWSDRGPWPRGAALPGPGPDPGSAPPGWLASGLPQGVPVLLARVRPGSGPGGGGASGAEERTEPPRWLRVTGL